MAEKLGNVTMVSLDQEVMPVKPRGFMRSCLKLPWIVVRQKNRSLFTIYRSLVMFAGNVGFWPLGTKTRKTRGSDVLKQRSDVVSRRLSNLF